MTQKEINEISALHKEAVLISKTYFEYEFRLIEILQKIDHKKGFRVLGYTSLYQYANIALKLSNNSAYTFVNVARKARGLTKLQEALKTGVLSVTKAKKISSVIMADNQDHWIQTAKNLSQRSLERAVARVNPKSSVEEGMRFAGDRVLEFKAAIDLDTEKLIQRAQDILSQSKGRHVSYDEVLKEMAKTFLEKKDPVIKAQRVITKRVRQNLPHASKNKSQDLFVRRPLSQDLKHQVYLRDEGQCQVESCQESRWVDIHHKIPVSHGGENILENLVTLCRAHHQMEHDGVH